MSKNLNIAQRIKGLKVGQQFTVKTDKDRQLASREAKSLRRAGVIDFQIVTRREIDPEGGTLFKVAAI